MATFGYQALHRLFRFNRIAVKATQTFNFTPIGSRTIIQDSALKAFTWKLRAKEEEMQFELNKETFLHGLTEVGEWFNGEDIQNAIFLADEEDCEILMDIIQLYEMNSGYSNLIVAYMTYKLTVLNMASHVAEFLSDQERVNRLYCINLIPALDCLYDNKMYDEVIYITSNMNLEAKLERAFNAEWMRNCIESLKALSLFAKGDQESYDNFKAAYVNETMKSIKGNYRVLAALGVFALKMDDTEFAQAVLFNDIKEDILQSNCLPLLNAQVLFHLSSNNPKQALKGVQEILRMHEHGGASNVSLLASDIMTKCSEVASDSEDDIKDAHSKLVKHAQERKLVMNTSLEEALVNSVLIKNDHDQKNVIGTIPYRKETFRPRSLQRRLWYPASERIKLFLDSDIYN